MKKTTASLAMTLLATTLLTQVACSGTPIVPVPPMQAPPGLSMARVDAAIRAGINRASQGSTGVWVVEKSSPGVIVAGIHVRTHYLQVTLSYTPASVVSTITASSNLDQADGSIHKHAITWQERLDTYIQDELNNAAAHRP